jgi:hypothetical protein
MRGDVHASIAAIMARHGVDFVPGSVELADFDPTSTAIAFDPSDEADHLPRDAIEGTFERYWREFEARRSGVTAAEAFTPYEFRNVVALLRLGWKERALALLEWLVGQQRPAAWRQWPEIVWRDDRGRFLGDLPHGWVASTFLRAVRRLFAYERDVDGALVIAAGVPEAWVREAPGVRVHGLPTRFGPLDFTMYADEARRVRVTFGGRLRRPPGGIVVASPLALPLREVSVDGRPLPGPHGGSVRLRELPTEVVLAH